MKQDEKSSWGYKWVLIVLLLFAGLSNAISDASGVYIVQQYNKNNQSFIRIINQTKYNLYCTIEGDQYFRDFTLYANRSSRWYVEPFGEYIWECR